MPIKPKPTPTLKARPGTTEEVFARTLAGAEALWRETQIESLIEKTMQLFHSNFAIPSVAVLKLSGGDEKPLSEVPGSGIGQYFTSEKLAEICAILRPVMLSPETADGIQSLKVEDKTVHFARLGDQQQEPYLLLWLDAKKAHESAEVAVDFLVRQLQNTYSWFSRIAETQTLLHLDDLTGLYNHRYLDIALDRETKRSARYNSSFCLLFIDLDHFKPVNDTYGHLAGSQVLREVAAIIRATVRDVDLVFRFGGDEFVVLLIEAESATGLKTAVRIQERIQASKFVVAKDAIARVTSSIGVAAFPEHADEKERLIAVADECMYESKRRGKNQCVLATTENKSASGPNPSEQKDPKTWS
ncbi:MAG: GGDEF domain-containing protein, partial [Bdellovibrionota bacterium]